MINIEDFKKRIGQFFVLGFQGEKPSDEFLNFINRNKIGGVILFMENCPDHSTIKSNIELIKKSVTDSLIAVDQEGGRVSRVTGGGVEIANAFEYSQKLGLEKFRYDYLRSIKVLKSLGFNLNLAPVCDIFLNTKNECLKDRCFGTTIETVVPFVTESVKIAKENEMFCCLKHFPGLGASNIDPHVSVAIAEYDYDLWTKREKIAFEKGIDASADMVMSTHLKLPSFENEVVTVSKKIISSLLRDALNFDKLLITDDLLMEGASSVGDINQRTVSAFNAGHDLLLFGQDFKKAKEAFNYFEDAVNKEVIDYSRIEKSLTRIEKLKRNL